MSNTGHIFLSYRSIEADFALQLAADLKNAGANLWMDRLEVGIKVGDDWVQALQNALDTCSAMIAVLSPSYVGSKFCRRELKRADGSDKPIFPVLLRKLNQQEWPFEIQEKQYIDFTEWRDEKSYKKQFDELVNVCRNRYPEQFGAIPDVETRYLNRLIADLEAHQGVLEYVELKGATDAPPDPDPVRPAPRKQMAAGFRCWYSPHPPAIRTPPPAPPQTWGGEKDKRKEFLSKTSVKRLPDIHVSC